MKFKTQYNIGDIVIFSKSDFKKDIGAITGIKIFFSWEAGQRTNYDIKPFAVNEDIRVCNNVEIREHEIVKKLNKKAFEKAYAEKCAEIKTKGMIKSE